MDIAKQLNPTLQKKKRTEESEDRKDPTLQGKCKKEVEGKGEQISIDHREENASTFIQKGKN